MECMSTYMRVYTGGDSCIICNIIRTSLTTDVYRPKAYTVNKITQQKEMHG